MHPAVLVHKPARMAGERVRQDVTAVGEQALGLPVRRVDIEVVDLWEA